MTTMMHHLIAVRSVPEPEIREVVIGDDQLIQTTASLDRHYDTVFELRVFKAKRGKGR